MPSQEELKSFYDGFLVKLATENARHLKIYQSLDKLPIGKTLDIGCGAGLTSKYLANRGCQVTAIDFSPVAISHAKRHNGHDRITYLCSGISDYKTSEKFDIICMVDVLEHLDAETTDSLFNLIKSATHDNSILYLNVPYSYTTWFLKQNYPEVLQPIDEPQSIEDIITNFESIYFIPFMCDMYWMQYFEAFFCTINKFGSDMKTAFKSLNRSNVNG